MQLGRMIGRGKIMKIGGIGVVNGCVIGCCKWLDFKGRRIGIKGG